MGIRISTTSVPEFPEVLESPIYDQEGKNYQYCNRYGSLHSQQGGKTVNQDSAVLCQGYGAEDCVFCGVFDGHGRYGHVVSKVVSHHLPFLILEQKNAVSEVKENYCKSQSTNSSGLSSSPNKDLLEWKKACINAFQLIDAEMINKADLYYSGSTAVVALKKGDDLLLANLGDSRAILGSKRENDAAVVQLTTDLTPSIPDEADRIRRHNGRVFALKHEPGVQRAWLPCARIPGLAMSRSFGDFVMKNHGIISTPVITHHHITSHDMFILLASDGVWDVLSNEEVASIVWSKEHEDVAAKAVVDAAVVAWKLKFPFDKPDDCTAVCYFLQRKDYQTQAKPPLVSEVPMS